MRSIGPAPYIGDKYDREKIIREMRALDMRFCVVREGTPIDLYYYRDENAMREGKSRPRSKCAKHSPLGKIIEIIEIP